MEKTVKKKIVENYIAVFDLRTRGKVDKDISYPLSESIRKELVHSGKYEVIDRDNMDKILKEQKFQLSGCTASACIVDAGQLLGVGKIITGSISILGKTYYLSLSLVNVETGKIENVSEDKCKCEIDELIDASKRLAQRLLGVTVTTGPPTETKTPMEPPKAAGVAPSAYKDTFTGMELVFVKGGCYQMGDTFSDGYENEKPAHEVCINDFYMGKYEVTQGQWRQTMGNNPSQFKNCGDSCPVEQVSWDDIQQFIQNLNQRTGKRYRLPTEAEWEYACRSGGKQEKYAGTSSDSELGNYAWYGSNSGSKPHPVGQKRPNNLGLYDMIGNVWEWVQDWYDAGYYKNSLKNNPQGPSSGSDRVNRGGGWFNEPFDLRCSIRFVDDPSRRSGIIGFRLAAEK